jgi:hypothetical protein
MLQPRGDLNVLGALAQNMFTSAGGEHAPQPPGQILIGAKNYYGAAFGAALAAAEIRLLRPARKGEPEPWTSRVMGPGSSLTAVSGRMALVTRRTEVCLDLRMG